MSRGEVVVKVVKMDPTLNVETRYSCFLFSLFPFLCSYLRLSSFAFVFFQEQDGNAVYLFHANGVRAQAGDGVVPCGVERGGAGHDHGNIELAEFPSQNNEHTVLRIIKGEVEVDQLKAERKVAHEQRRNRNRKPGLSVTYVVVEGENFGKLTVGCAWHEIVHVERAGAVDAYFV